MEKESSPCGGCRYCPKAHQNWERFAEVVDYMVPLAGRTPRVQSNQVLEIPGRPTGVPSIGFCTTENLLEEFSKLEEIIREDSSIPVETVAIKVNGGRDVSARSSVTEPEETDVESSSSFGHSKGELASAHQEDMDLKGLREWMEEGTSPQDAQLYLSNPAAKFYWLNKEMFSKDIHGLLYIKDDTFGETHDK